MRCHDILLLLHESCAALRIHAALCGVEDHLDLAYLAHSAWSVTPDRLRTPVRLRLCLIQRVG